MKTSSFVPAGALMVGAAAFSLSLLATAARAHPDAAAIGIAPIGAFAGASDNAQTADALGDLFATFAGSEDSAEALITGLHNGTSVDLTTTVDGQTATTTITPATSTLSYGNIFLALALAQEELTKLGITQPTSAQIQAALDGGSVTTGTGTTAVTTQLSGVLTLHDQNMTWKQVAQSLNVDLATAVHDSRSSGALVIDRLGDRYEQFTGSEENGEALVKALHDGTAVTLTTTVNGETTTVTFTPATGQLSYGNVSLALALAQEDLMKLGISQPTAAEIQAALNGGSVTTGTGTSAVTTQLTGVLVLRNQGQGWGQIAQTLGVSIGAALRDARVAESIDHLGDRFTTLLGSEDNADALIKGLHNGTAVTLTSTVNGTTTTVTVNPATGKMGLGSVALSLTLAQEELTKLGDTAPTLADLQAALNGGSVTVGTGTSAVTTQLTGVLTLRDQGMNWTQVAQTLGVTLGPPLRDGVPFAPGHFGAKFAWHDRMEEAGETAPTMPTSAATNAAEAGPMETQNVATQAGAAVMARPVAMTTDGPSAAASARPAMAAIVHPDVASGRPAAATIVRPVVPTVVRPVQVEHFVRPDIPVRPPVLAHH